MSAIFLTVIVSSNLPIALSNLLAMTSGLLNRALPLNSAFVPMGIGYNESSSFVDFHDSTLATLRKSFKSNFQTNNRPKHQALSPDASVISIAPFTCAEFPPVYSPFSMCSTVVDYPFMLWNSDSLESLEVTAREAASHLNEFMSTECLTDAKRLICAQVYQPCVQSGFAINIFLFLMTIKCLFLKRNPMM
jgi:hypothetical protein